MSNLPDQLCAEAARIPARTPPGLHERILRAVVAAPQAPPSRSIPWPAALAAAAVLAATVGLAWMAMPNTSPPVLQPETMASPAIPDMPELPVLTALESPAFDELLALGGDLRLAAATVRSAIPF